MTITTLDSDVRSVASRDSGLVHINDKPTNDEAIEPFGGVSASGNGSRTGGAEADIAACTDTQWLTVRGQIASRAF
jgi:benzaldehyde dehydrogenase (NAD)